MKIRLLTSAIRKNTGNNIPVKIPVITVKTPPFKKGYFYSFLSHLMSGSLQKSKILEIMKIKLAYPTPAFRDKQNTGSDKLTHPQEEGINNLELCCFTIAPGIIGKSNPSDTAEEIATRIINQAVAIIEGAENR